MQTGAGRDPELHIQSSEEITKADFFSSLGIPWVGYKDVRNTEGRPRKRRAASEQRESKKQREGTKDSQGKTKMREFPGPIEFCNWVFIINHKSYVLDAKQRSHTWSHLILTTTPKVCVIICRTVLGVAKGKIQTTVGWEVTEWENVVCIWENLG